MLILGEKEQQGGVVAVRTRTGGDEGQMSIDQFVQKCTAEVEARQ